MWNLPSEKELAKIPKLGVQDGKGKDIMIHMHFFMGNSDWYVAEFDGKDTFFGFVCLNGWKDLAEWGYFSFKELKELKAKTTIKFDGELVSVPMEVDRNMHWTPKKVTEIPLIMDCCNWLREE